MSNLIFSFGSLNFHIHIHPAMLHEANSSRCSNPGYKYHFERCYDTEVNAMFSPPRLSLLVRPSNPELSFNLNVGLLGKSYLKRGKVNSISHFGWMSWLGKACIFSLAHQESNAPHRLGYEWYLGVSVTFGWSNRALVGWFVGRVKFIVQRTPWWGFA